MGSSSLTRELNLGPLHKKPGVLATGPFLSWQAQFLFVALYRFSCLACAGSGKLLLVSLPKFTFSGVIWVARNQVWWVYLHLGNWQTFHLGDVLFSFLSLLVSWLTSISAHSLASLGLVQLAWWRGVEGRKETDNKSSVNNQSSKADNIDPFVADTPITKCRHCFWTIIGK